MKHHTKLRSHDSLTGFLFCLPSILGLLVFFIIPFGITVRLSFMESRGSDVFVGLKNYSDVLNSATFRLAAKNTLKFNAIAVPLILILSFAVAMLLYKKLRGYNFFRTVFVFPLVLPVASVVLFFQIIFNESGVVNRILELFNLDPVNWMNSGAAFVVLLVLYLWKNAGYNIILFLAALNSIPREYYEAAEIDGAGSWVKTTRITLPLIVPYTFFIVVISIVNSFKAFREAFILFGSHPDQSIYMLQHFMNNNFDNLNYIRLSVGAILLFLVIFVLMFILLKIRNKGDDAQ